MSPALKEAQGTPEVRWTNPSAGYTLVEVLVVLGIIAMLTAVVGPRLLTYFGEAKVDTAKLQINQLSSAVELYYLDTGGYPSAEAGLSALVSKPAGAARWSGPYLKKADGLIDPWGRPYIYRSPGEHGDFDILSLGRDNAKGGDGEDLDIGSW